MGHPKFLTWLFAKPSKPVTVAPAPEQPKPVVFPAKTIPSGMIDMDCVAQSIIQSIQEDKDTFEPDTYQLRNKTKDWTICYKEYWHEEEDDWDVEDLWLHGFKKHFSFSKDSQRAIHKAIKQFKGKREQARIQNEKKYDLSLLTAKFPNCVSL